jgi:class 3 adenylate cyclase
VRALRSSFGRPVDVAERLETRNATVEPNVHVPADVGESTDDLMGDGINIAARLGGIAQPSTTRLSEEACRQRRG